MRASGWRTIVCLRFLLCLLVGKVDAYWQVFSDSTAGSLDLFAPLTGTLSLSLSFPLCLHPLSLASSLPPQHSQIIFRDSLLSPTLIPPLPTLLPFPNHPVGFSPIVKRPFPLPLPFFPLLPTPLVGKMHFFSVTCTSPPLPHLPRPPSPSSPPCRRVLDRRRHPARHKRLCRARAL